MNYACSGATAANVINTPQQVTYSGGGTSTVIPQIQNLTGYEDDIALTVGPDGLSCANYDCKFATVLKTCVSIPVIYSHTQPCQPEFDPTNDPEVTNAIAALEPVLVQAYEAIHQAAPTAQIYVLSYPPLFHYDATQSSCEYIAESDIQWLMSKESQLNSVVQQAVADAGPRYRQ